MVFFQCQSFSSCLSFCNDSFSFYVVRFFLIFFTVTGFQFQQSDTVFGVEKRALRGGSECDLHVCILLRNHQSSASYLKLPNSVQTVSLCRCFPT